ncbi:hypothetical protein [Marinobacterium sp. BA1]|uniref:hypothetical protein n=1 Tax=Marinobacterium sp. BA1 TaxID=3138931 RepID=UPI0032E7A370
MKRKLAKWWAGVMNPPQTWINTKAEAQIRSKCFWRAAAWMNCTLVVGALFALIFFTYKGLTTIHSGWDTARIVTLAVIPGLTAFMNIYYDRKHLLLKDRAAVASEKAKMEKD